MHAIKSGIRSQQKKINAENVNMHFSTGYLKKAYNYTLTDYGIWSQLVCF